MLTAAAETFPIRGTFRIARGARTEAVVVTATITEGEHTGRGECVPYPRYGESVEGVVSAIEAMAERVAGGIDPDGLRQAMPAGAARNALDAALLDIAAKTEGRHVADRFGVLMKPVTTAYTLSIDTPEAMGAAADEASDRPILKVKLGNASGDSERIAAVRANAPDATLVVDANEGWNDSNLLMNLSACADAGVALVEQPLPASRDGVLATISHPVPICADESCRDLATLAGLKGRYNAVNVKLDKAGGLTEAFAMVEAARSAGLLVMVGCMVGTSLAMAPAMIAAMQADYVDLDGPLLLARDREPGLVFEGSLVHPPPPALWG